MLRRLSSHTPLTLLVIPVFFGLLYAALTPVAISASTWVACAALLLGITIVTFNTASNAQQTGRFGQLLYQTDSPRRTVNRQKSVSKW